MTEKLASPALDQLFREARTRNAWKPEQLPESLWRELYDLVKFGPTSANASPARTCHTGKQQNCEHKLDIIRVTSLVQAVASSQSVRMIHFWSSIANW